MKRLSTVMIVVAILALNLAAIRTFEYGLEDRLVFDALPTVNVLMLAGILYRRAFIPGFVSAGSLSLIGYQHWAHEHPWRWLQYVTPTFQFLDRNLLGLPPYPRYGVLYGLAIIAFAIPHILLGLAGGFLSGKGWGLIRLMKGDIRP